MFKSISNKPSFIIFVLVQKRSAKKKFSFDEKCATPRPLDFCSTTSLLMLFLFSFFILLGNCNPVDPGYPVDVPYPSFESSNYVNVNPTIEEAVVYNISAVLGTLRNRWIVFLSHKVIKINIKNSSMLLFETSPVFVKLIICRILESRFFSKKFKACFASR